MGKEKFYMYDGTVRNLRCDVKKYIFTDINILNKAQIFAGTNEDLMRYGGFIHRQIVQQLIDMLSTIMLKISGTTAILLGLHG